MSDEEDFKSLLVRLPRFTAGQRREIAAKLKASAQTSDAPSDAEEDDWLYRGLCVALRERGLLSRTSEYGLTRTKGHASYLKLAPRLRRELETLLPERNRSQGRLTLAHVVGLALVRYCRARDPEASAGYVLTNAGSAFEALEHCYPGYIEANLFHVVIGGFKDGSS